MRNFIEDLIHFKAILSTQKTKQVDLLNNLSIVIKTCAMFFLFFSFGSQVKGQPVVKKGPSVVSKLHPHTEDWPLAMISGSDCYHIYFAGFTQCEGDSGGDCPDHRRLPVMGCFDKITGTLLWEKEYEFFPGFATVYGNFTTIYEDGNYLWGAGGVRDQSGKWQSFIVKANKTTGVPEAGYPKLIQVSVNLPGKDVSSRIFGMSPIISNNTVTGYICSGEYHGSGNNSTKQAMIVKLLADGTLDNSWGNNKDANGNPSPNGAYFGPVGSSARTVIPIQGFNIDTKFAYVGNIINSNNNLDVYCEGLYEDGTDKNWSQQLDEGMPGYVDVDPSGDKTVCNCPMGQEVNNDIQRGYDILQNGSGDIYISALFDDLEGDPKDLLCPLIENLHLDYYLDIDAVIIRMNRDNGNVISSKNVNHFNGSDFQLDLELKNGNIYMLGAKSYVITEPCMDPDHGTLITKTAVVKIDPNLNIVWQKEFNATNPTAKINCSFALTFDCDDNLLVTGNNELNDEDYYFYTLSDECQTNFVFDEPNNRNTFGLNETWSSNKTIGATIIVPLLSTLTINPGVVISFGASWETSDYDVRAQKGNDLKAPRIIVYGTLILNGCTLKGLNACGKDWMWDGIELRQSGHIIATGATIQDAKYGILADKAEFDEFGNYNPTEFNGGGIVNASGGNILNCRRGVHFAYCNGNTSTFTSVSFLCNNFLKDPSYKLIVADLNTGQPKISKLGTKIFASSHHASGLTFNGCTFSNTANLIPTLKSTGINSFDAGYDVFGCTFNNLYTGILANNPNELMKNVKVLENNTFTNLNLGIQFKSGSLHDVSDNNTFSPSSFQYANGNGIPQISAGIGILNQNSTKIFVADNHFAGSPQDILTYGVLSDKTQTASEHKHNDFINLSYGEQTQYDNSGLYLNCNTHQYNRRAWQILDQLRDQGDCPFNLPQFPSFTPDNKFKDPTSASDPYNHIFATDGFKYQVPNGGQADAPQFITNNVVLNLCANGNLQSGCDIDIKITFGNVVQRRSDYDGMSDGMNRRLLGNNLLRFYSANNLIVDFMSILSGMNDDENKRMYAQILLSQGQISQSQAVVATLDINLLDNISFGSFFNILLNLKQQDLGLNQMSEPQINILVGIAYDHTSTSFKAQAILEQFYGYHFPIEILQADGNMMYRSKSDDKKRAVKDSNLENIRPNPALDEVIISYNLNHLDISEINLSIYNIYGLLVKEMSLDPKMNEIKVDISNLPSSTYFVKITERNQDIQTVKFIKM